jgi:hypothetical protein
LSLVPGRTVYAPATIAARTTAEIDGSTFIDVTFPDRPACYAAVAWG